MLTHDAIAICIIAKGGPALFQQRIIFDMVGEMMVGGDLEFGQALFEFQHLRAQAAQHFAFGVGEMLDAACFAGMRVALRDDARRNANGGRMWRHIFHHHGAAADARPRQW